MESLMFWSPHTPGLDFLANQGQWAEERKELEKNGDSTLLRPLGFMESGVATAHTYGSSNIVYALRMHGRQPVQGDDVLRALTIIQSRIQNLRLCIREAYGRRYFAEMHRPRVLFTVREADDWMQEYESQLQAVFDTAHGPLWSASLLTLPGVNNANSESHDANEPGREPRPYPFVAMLVLTFCHAISDGSSNAVFCNQFLDVLNKVVDKAEIPEVPQIMLREPLEDMPLGKEKQYTPSDVVSLASHLWDLVFAPRNHYLATHPPPAGCKEIRMRTYSLVLSAEQTRSVTDRCKAEGVTVHAAFTVAASLALHELIRRRQPELSQLRVRSGHVVNFRRFLQKQHQDAYGCYMGFFEASVPSSPDGRSRFWELARDTVQSMKHRLDTEMQPVTYSRLLKTFISTDLWVHRQHTKEMPHVSHYFGTSNMGNLDRLFDATGKHVEVTQLVRTTNIGHDLGMVFAHMFHTLRGRLMYNLDYLVAAIAEPQAREYAEKTLEVLTTAAAAPVGAE
ncbi:uncharacterized protein LOC122389265 isoform X2 [Amphibalanus amphitrite]|uniref:uncharacterized protein LOC122389265 isoform X2 n=1 Tax=Amphibalanus amphitrite TaxID=1232801 RepID=UPI001C8FFBEE|nr:uncharacterized protein LOC122389265 isoform X2 [Amphibalanus amphitrite]